MDGFFFSLTLTGIHATINDLEKKSCSSLLTSSYTKTNLYCEYQNRLFSDSKKWFFLNFITFHYASIFLMLIVNTGIFYVSSHYILCKFHWAGTRKKLSGKVFILLTMKTRYYCLMWPFINVGYSILHNRFLVHTSITDLYCRKLMQFSL